MNCIASPLMSERQHRLRTAAIATLALHAGERYFESSNHGDMIRDHDMAISPEVIGSVESPLTWEEFEIEIGKLREQLRKEKEKGDAYRVFEEWLFRGQRDATWGLTTSLERFLDKSGQKDIEEIEFNDYFNKMLSAIPAVNSLAGKSFDRDVRPADSPFSPWKMEALETIYYMRHHTFPTPTLDWSRSYFVSAFFAFQDASPATPVAIYAYNDSIEKTRVGSLTVPLIQRLGPYVETHRRHYLQQSEYTYCTTGNADGLFFAKHDDAMMKSPRNHPCRKFILAGSEREKVLHKLDEANINAYTLYGNEEGLMDMLAFRELRF